MYTMTLGVPILMCDNYSSSLVPPGSWTIVCLHGSLKDSSKDILGWMWPFVFWQLTDVVVDSVMVINLLFVIYKSLDFLLECYKNLTHLSHYFTHC